MINLIIESSTSDDIVYQTYFNRSIVLVTRFLRPLAFESELLPWSPLDVDSLEANVSFCNAGKVVQILNDHQHFVQGVAWDPAGEFLASISSDRTCRIYSRQPAPKKSKKRKITVVEDMFTCRQILAKTEVEASKATTTTDADGKTSKVSYFVSNWRFTIVNLLKNLIFASRCPRNFVSCG